MRPHRGAQVELMRLGIGGQTAQMFDQVARLAFRGGQLKCIPTDTHDEIGFIAALRPKTLQHWRAGIIAITDTDFARQRDPTLERFGTVLISQLKVREPAASEVEYAMDPPVRALAAGFADAGAVGEMERAPGPAQIGPRHLSGKLPLDHRREKICRLV